MDIFNTSLAIAKLFKISNQHLAKFLTHGRIYTWGLIAICNQFEFLVQCMFRITVLSVTLSQAVGLSSLIVPWVKNSLMVLLATSIAELGIRRTKGSSGLGKKL